MKRVPENRKRMKTIDRMLRDIDMEVQLTRELFGEKSLDQRILKAMQNIERDKFVPSEMRMFAYDNRPIPIGLNQTISQPFIVALMTDLLCPQPDNAILEIGTGSGYQAAVLSLLVKQVFSVEILEALYEQASLRLRELGYTNVKVRSGDGYQGWPEHAPYDGIVVTAAAPIIPQPLIDQLKPGGVLVIPVGLPRQYQELMLIKKHENGKIETRDILGVAFVPLTGTHI